MFWRFLGALLLVACQARVADRAPEAPASSSAPEAPASSSAPAVPDAPTATPAAAAGKDANPVFPRRVQGWEAVDSATAERIGRFAGDYADYLASAKTPRRAVAGLVALFRDGAGELTPGKRPARAPGSRYFFVSPGGDAAAFVRLGQAPLEQGVRVIVAAVDAPRIDLKQAPGYSKAGLAMLDTELYGDVDLESWLSRPLALYLHVARPGAADGGLDVIVGEAAGDPVLLIPDLAPHLSRKVQGRQIVDSPERMDAIAARSRQAWAGFLASQGLDEGTLVQAEASLVPAGRPEFIGVDRALLSGHGHSHRAFAYAAVRALAEAGSGQGAAVVIVVSRAEAGGEGSTGWNFVKIALSRLLAALSEKGAALDILDTRRAYARSAALVTAPLTGELGKGLILNPRSDDAVPFATRAALDSLTRAGAQYQMSDKRGWGPSRGLSSLDMDFVDIAIPIKGKGAPVELLSTLDLYQAWLAATSWLAGS
jgi:aspartyl aminopeptidase